MNHDQWWMGIEAGGKLFHLLPFFTRRHHNLAVVACPTRSQGPPVPSAS
jgi:hypothetical protein